MKKKIFIKKEGGGTLKRFVLRMFSPESLVYVIGRSTLVDATLYGDRTASQS